MRVCIVVPYDLAADGGVKVHAVHLAEALRRLGDEVDILGPCSHREPLGDGFHGFGGVVKVWSSGSYDNLGIFVSPRKLWRRIRERQYDVVHVHEPLVPALNYWAAWGAGAAARVCTFHSFDEEVASPGARRIASLLAFPHYDRGIAVSPLAARLARQTWRGPLAVIPNGVATSVFAPPRAEAAPRPGQPVRLLFVGCWRNPRKGLPYLIDAYRSLRDRGIPVTLDVIGDGGGARPEQLPGLTYHGIVPSEELLARHYARSDIFISPAAGAESFGLVLLEAMAAGRPIICSDIAGYRHVVAAGSDGAGARLVPPRSVEALAEAIAELAANPAQRRRMGSLNRHRAFEFDWDNVAPAVREEYLTAIEARHGAGVARAHLLPQAIESSLTS